MSELSHVDESTGEVRMVDVGAKPVSRRRAVARGRVRMTAATAERLRALPKGDALAVARIAGIQAAKRTSDLIPLCHPLPLTLVDLRVHESVEPHCERSRADHGEGDPRHRGEPRPPVDREQCADVRDGEREDRVLETNEPREADRQRRRNGVHAGSFVFETSTTSSIRIALSIAFAMS